MKFFQMWNFFYSFIFERDEAIHAIESVPAKELNWHSCQYPTKNSPNLKKVSINWKIIFSTQTLAEEIQESFFIKLIFRKNLTNVAKNLEFVPSISSDHEPILGLRYKHLAKILTRKFNFGSKNEFSLKNYITCLNYLIIFYKQYNLWKFYERRLLPY